MTKDLQTEHAGPKHGAGAYWGPKADAKDLSDRQRRLNDRREAAQGVEELDAEWSIVVVPVEEHEPVEVEPQPELTQPVLPPTDYLTTILRYETEDNFPSDDDETVLLGQAIYRTGLYRSTGSYERLLQAIIEAYGPEAIVGPRPGDEF